MTVNKPQLSLSWDPPEGNFDKYQMAIYRWQTDNSFESTSIQTNFFEIDKDETTYETKTVKIGVDQVELKFCYAYKIQFSVKGGDQGYQEDTTQYFYVCTVPDSSFEEVRNKTSVIKITAKATVAGSSTYVYSSGSFDNVADLYVYWGSTEQAVKLPGNTNYRVLGTNVTAKLYSEDILTSELSGFGSKCYFAIKAVLKIDNNKPGVYTNCEESWSEVKCLNIQ